MTKTRPKRADLKNARALFAAFGQYLEKVVAGRRLSSVRYRMKKGNIFIPFSVKHWPTFIALQERRVWGTVIPKDPYG